MSEFLSEDPTPIERERLQAAFALFEAARTLIGLDTSQDPYHKIFRSFIAETERRPAGRILEVGSRAGPVISIRAFSEILGNTSGWISSKARTSMSSETSIAYRHTST